MEVLLLLNALLFICLHVVWAKSDIINLTLKIAFLVLAISNGYQSYQLFEVARIEAASKKN